VLGQTVVISAGPFSLRMFQSAGVDRESCTEDTVYSDCTVYSSAEVQSVAESSPGRMSCLVFQSAN